jgi:HlyD family secretion protein
MAKKKSKKRLIIILSIIVLLIVVIAAVVATNKGEKPIAVTVSKVEKRTITQSVTAVGTIEAETEVKISSETSGEIVDLPFKEGDFVRRGAMLARIKPDIIEMQLEQSRQAAEASKSEIEVRKSALDKLQKEFDRIAALLQKKHVSQNEYDAAAAALEQAKAAYNASKAGYNQALASLEQVERNKSRTVLFAPIEGTITKLSVLNGEKVVGTSMMQGTEMMRISDLNDMNAIVEVSENEIVRVELGDSVKIEIDAFPDRIFTGIVREIGHSAITNSTGTIDQEINFKVKIKILDNEKKLRPGMSCSAEIMTETKYNVLAVPKQSVTVRESENNNKPDIEETGLVLKKEDEQDKNKKKERPPSVVFVKDGNKVKQVTVKYGIADKDYVEIIEGLNEGDEVVSGSYDAIFKQLKDGSSIFIDSTDNKKFNKKK